jgi:hypothetical protein
MFPPSSLMMSTDSSENTTDRLELSRPADPESLRHQRRPSATTGARRIVETISELVDTLKGSLDGSARFLDGLIVEVNLRLSSNIMAKNPTMLSCRNLVKRSFLRNLVLNIRRYLGLHRILPRRGQIVHHPDLPHECLTIFDK